jgi:hypothetical protein
MDTSKLFICCNEFKKEVKQSWKKDFLYHSYS